MARCDICERYINLQENKYYYVDNTNHLFGCCNECYSKLIESEKNKVKTSSKIKLIEEKDIKTRKLANISNNLSGFRFLGILSALGVFFIPILSFSDGLFLISFE